MDWKARVRAALASASEVPDDATGTERERVEVASRGAASAEASAPKAGGPGVIDDSVVEELAQHARATYDASRADGCTHHEADARVTELLTRWRSDASALHHRSRRLPVVEPPAVDTPSWFAGLGRDIRYATRLLRRQPRFAIIAILTMALGIGTTTLLFSVTYGVLMEPLPWADAERIVVLKETRGGNPPRFGAFSNTAYAAWSAAGTERERVEAASRGAREASAPKAGGPGASKPAQASTLDALAAWSQRSVTMTGAGEPDRLRIIAASASLFTVLGARPLIGTLFEAKDETSPVVVLSESLWRQRFGADPSDPWTAGAFRQPAVHRHRRAARADVVSRSAVPRLGALPSSAGERESLCRCSRRSAGSALVQPRRRPRRKARRADGLSPTPA